MRIFLDASAIVALLAREPEAGWFDHFVAIYPDRVSSAVAVWEASRGLAEARGVVFEEARALVAKFIAVMNIRLVPIGAEEAVLALDAHQRHGKGRHRAKLNMGTALRTLAQSVTPTSSCSRARTLFTRI